MDEIAEQSRASIQKEDLKILLPIIAKIKPQAILEIGMHQGYSMELWRNAFNPALLYGVEINKPTPDSYTEELGMMWQQDSRLPLSIKIPYRIDFLFLDGDHEEISVRKDFEIYSPFVRKGGIIALHDCIYTAPNVQVKPLWEELKLKYPYIEIKTKDSTGMGVIWV